MERTMSTARLWPTLALAALAVGSGLLWGRDASASPGTTERVSVASDGTQGNGDSGGPALSADGRFVAFGSDASNLVPGDTNNVCDTDFDGVYADNCSDVFVYDRLTGLTERVSVTSDGREGNGNSFVGAISADGRFVAFSSYASNLVPGDTNYFCDTNADLVYADNCPDVFVHDRLSGTTERVSIASNGAQGNGESIVGALSADGRFVAFYSRASNLVPGDTNYCGYPPSCGDVFVHDRLTGATERVSVGSDGTEGNVDSFAPAISADGRFVAFESWASNIVPNDTNARMDAFVHDRATRVTERISVAFDGTEGNSDSRYPVLSADGRLVAFVSSASNLVPGDTNGSNDLFVRDRETGTTDRVSVASDGTQGNDWSGRPSISADGRFVAFASDAFNLVPEDTNDIQDVFVHDRCPGGVCPGTIGLLGDVTCDGAVDAVDALFILQCVVGLPPGSGMAFCTQGGP